MVSERTGLDSVTLGVLETLEALEARSGSRYVKSSTVVQRLDATHGIPAQFGYEALCCAASPWLTHVLLVDFHGNVGSADPQDDPAAPRYTEARLAAAGEIALASERGELPRLPIGLINGDFAFRGTAPPFDPARIAAAVHAASTGERSDSVLVDMVGVPASPTGCAVEVDLAELAAGARTKIRMRAHVAVEPGPRGQLLVLSHFPLGSSAEAAGTGLAARIDAAEHRRQWNPEIYERMTIALRDVRNESSGNITRLVCELKPDADVDLCRERVLDTWPVTVEFPVQLRAPLATLLRQFADEPVRQGDAMRALLRSH